MSGARIVAVVAIAVLTGALPTAPAEAISLTLESATPSVLLGETVFVDVDISGLGDGVAPSLSTFDLDVVFDVSVLGFVDVSFGGGLGDPGLGQAFVSSGVSGGVVDLAEVSLVSSATLDALQPVAFTLATLEFTALAPGASFLDFTQVILGDSAGAPLFATTAGLEVVVPEPDTGLLVGLGVAGLALARRRRRVS